MGENKGECMLAKEEYVKHMYTFSAFYDNWEGQDTYAYMYECMPVCMYICMFANSPFHDGWEH